MITINNATLAADYNAYYEDEIRLDIKNGCSMDKVKLITKTTNKIWFDNVYDPNVYKKVWDKYILNFNANCSSYNDRKPIENGVFDEYLWIDITDLIEEYRQEVYSALLEFGVDVVDSHFLSIKFAINTVKKFRGKMCNSYNVDESKDKYNRSFLRPSFITLITRFESMLPRKTYTYSKKGADTYSYRRQAAWLCAQMIDDKTSAIITSKIII